MLLSLYLCKLIDLFPILLPTAEKYCMLVENEGGLEVLQSVIDDPAPYAKIKELASCVIYRCNTYKNSQNSAAHLDG